MNKIKEFYQWMNERHSIYLKKSKGLPPPWTEDPIMQKYHFCHVYRHLDKGTKWIMRNTKEICQFDANIRAEDEKDVLFQVCQYRYLNNPDFFDTYSLADIHGWGCAGREDFEEALRGYKETKGFLFNTAYTVFKTFNNSTGLRDTIASYALLIDKIYQQIDEFHKELKNAETGEDAHKVIIKFCKGAQGFLAYEIWCDLVLLKALRFTENDFVNVGQGAVQGLQIIFPDLEVEKFRQDQCVQLIKILQKEQESMGWVYEPLTLRSIEHSACEFRKWTHMKEGHGRPRLYHNKQ